MDRILAHQATPPDYELAEGALWDDRSERLHWVDIPAGAVITGELGIGVHEIGRTVLGGDVSAVGLAEDGGLIVAVDAGLATIDPHGRIHRGPALRPPHRHTRMNDGACDPQGRFLVGSLSLDDATCDEVLLQAEPTGAVTVLRTGIGLSNGIGWSPGGDLAYHVDTRSRTVSSAHYDPSTGRATGWRPLFTVDDGQPDGLTVDEEGLLWVAVWGTGQVRHYDSAGRVLAIVAVDAPQVSCPAFVGPGRDILAVTTARDGLTPSELTRHPASGALFLARPGTKGTPENRWRGDTSAPVWGVPSAPVAQQT